MYIVLGCDDDGGNLEISDDDKVTQLNEQIANQEILSNSEVGDGGVLVNPHMQRSTQTAANVNTDNDVYIVLGGDDDGGNLEISDDDKVTQLNEQIANQEILSNSEVGDGGVLVNPHMQRSTQTATNYNEDNDRVVLV